MGDKDDKRKLQEVALSPIFIKRKRLNRRLTLSDSENSDDDSIDKESDSPSTPEDAELITFDTKIESLEDLITLGKKYDRTKKYDFDMKKLNKMIPDIENINNFIGLGDIKNKLVDHILFYLQSKNLKIDEKEKDIMHTIITGPPGVGKTEFARALGKLYLSMGVLRNNKFVKVTRADLVAKYLGQTAIKTKETINRCRGGVMFIDEVYSLGNKEQRDSFSKEAIDTLNEHLTEMKNDFICIVAGYEEDVKSCFFAFNKGLQSRFPIRFQMEGYDYKDLFKILKQKIDNTKWTLDEKITELFFKDKMDQFEYYGRDIENLITLVKRCHSRRVFTLSKSEKTKITMEDLKNGSKLFFDSNKEKEKFKYDSIYI